MRPNTRSIQDMLNAPRGIAGGADEEEHFENVPEELRADAARVGEMNDEELEAYEGRLVEAINAEAKNDSDEALATMEACAAVVDQVRSVRSEREAKAAERAQKRDQILQSVSTEGEGEEGSESTEGEGEGDGEGEEGTTEVTVETETTTEVSEPEAVAAAAPPAKPVAPRPTNKNRPANRAPREEPSESVSIIAAGDGRKHAPGKPMSFEEMGEAFAQKLDAVRNVRTPGRYMVATVEASYPEDRTLVASAGSAMDNGEKVRKVTEPEAIVAAGGFCAPVETDYSIPSVSTDDRPVRDALPRFGASRGGIQYFEPLKISDYAAASRIWTNADDVDALDAEGERKPCLRIACGDVIPVNLHAIPLCIEIGNFQRQFNQELFPAVWREAKAAHSRLGDNTLWNDMAAAGTAVSTGGTTTLGAARDSIAHILLAAAGLRSRNRMGREAPLRCMLPDWTIELVAIDLARQIPGDQTFEIGEPEILRWFAKRNINLTFSPDGGGQALGAQAAGPMVAFPDSVEALLFPEGSFVFLDGGELDFGLEVRDAALNAKNDSQAFMETFEAVAFRGVESLTISFDVCANGASAGTVDTSALCTPEV